MNKFKTILTIRFQPDKEITIAFLLGLLSVILSFFLNYIHSELIWRIIRDGLQVLLIGVIIPLIILSKTTDGLKNAGIRFDKKLKNISISIILGGLILFQFIMKEPEGLNILGWHSIGPAFYIMVANIFEIIFFFAFLRFKFEKAFGIIPAIILAAGFYSFHHAGFQPEFLKLFVVGLVFMFIYRIANNWLICFPAWWIGAIWDVLVTNYEKIDMVRFSRIWWVAIPNLLIMILIFVKTYSSQKKSNKNADNFI